MRMLETNEIKLTSGGIDPIVGLTVLAGTSLALGLYNSVRIKHITDYLAQTVPDPSLPYIVYQ